MVTAQQYNEALEVCKAYRAQVNSEVANFETTTIAEFKEMNDMSKRLKNVLQIAMDCGYVYVAQLTDYKMRRIRTCGMKSLREFQSLINK
jgi:hypothetical protein